MIEISQDNFEEQVMQAEIPVMIEFGAPWCGPCKRLEPELEKLAVEWEGRVRIAHINVDENPDLASNYMVMGVPTVLLVKAGEEQERISGFKPLPKLKEIFEKYLS